jgi:hypothetical protein
MRPAWLQIHLDEEDGGILVFLTGQEEIELCKQTLLDVGGTLSHPRNLELMPVAVYAALPAEEQTAAFAPLPKGTRKVVLATNIAETSVTIPGIRFVVDTGMVKARTYSTARSMESLQVCSASHRIAFLSLLPTALESTMRHTIPGTVRIMCTSCARGVCIAHKCAHACSQLNKSFAAAIDDREAVLGKGVSCGKPMALLYL